MIRNQRFFSDWKLPVWYKQCMQRFDFEIVFSTNLAIWQQVPEFSVSLWVEGVFRSYVVYLCKLSQVYIQVYRPLFQVIQLQTCNNIKITISFKGKAREIDQSTSNKAEEIYLPKYDVIHSPCCKKSICVSFSCVTFCDNSRPWNSRCYS